MGSLAREALDRAKARRAASMRRILVSTAVVTVVALILIGSLWGRGLFLSAPRLGAVDPAPSASAVEVALGPPVVHITLASVTIDGVVVDDPRPLAAEGKMRRMDGLFAALREHPARSARAVLLDIDEDVPAIVVKCAFQTAAYAGYPDVQFVVRADGREPLLK